MTSAWIKMLYLNTPSQACARVFLNIRPLVHEETSSFCMLPFSIGACTG
jgi:hypothetical protein